MLPFKKGYKLKDCLSSVLSVAGHLERTISSAEDALLQESEVGVYEHVWEQDMR